jgi:Acyl-coenzyme A:6-aminopenicillanic acid acyl-transferase
MKSAIKKVRYAAVIIVSLVLLGTGTIAYLGCGPGKTHVPRYQVLHMHGTYYEMGYQHGKAFRNEIRSIYSQFLTNSIMPFLNREYQYIAQYFSTYTREEQYLNGGFAFEFLLDAAKLMEQSMAPEHIQEMQGIAAGSGLKYEQILIANTFLDTLLGILTIDWYLKQVFSPTIVSFAVEGGSPSIEEDGLDNDGDGVIDETDEGLLYPYVATNAAHLSGIPSDPTFVYILKDLFADPGQGVNIDSLRFEINGKLYKSGDEGFSYTPGESEGGELRITPSEPLEPGSPVVLILNASDSEELLLPPPVHPNVLREERTVLFVRDDGVFYPPQQLPNYDFHPTNPGDVAASINFVVKDEATVDGQMIVGRNFNLLDNDVGHNHAAVFVYHPVDDAGNPMKSFATVAWTGIVWAMAGINEDGFVVTANRNETLNNTMAENVLLPANACGLIVGGIPNRDLSDFPCPIEGGLGGMMSECFIDGELDAMCMFQELLVEARLSVQGVPIGFVGRSILEKHGSISEAESFLKSIPKSAGWNILVADGNTREMAMFELNSDVLRDGTDGVTTVYPVSATEATLDMDTPNWVGINSYSLTPGDLRQSNHSVMNLDEIVLKLGITADDPIFTIQPQRFWASEYFTPVNTFNATGMLLKENYGQIDEAVVIEMLQRIELTDKRNSMQTVVFMPESKSMYVAVGELPSNSSPFDFYSSAILGFE